MKKYNLKWVGAMAGTFCCAGTLFAQSVGQWDFNSGNLTQTSGANLGDLTYNDGPSGQTFSNTVFATTTTLGIPDINGTPAKVMEFSAGSLPQGYLMPTPPPNGGGSLVNEYTIIMDVLYTNGGLFRPLMQMDDGALDHVTALFDVGVHDNLEVTNTLGGLLLNSGSFGVIVPNTWYRLGMVYDYTNGTASVYTNGVLLGVVNIGLGNLDSPFALLSSSVLPIFSSNITNAQGYVNSVQLRDEPLNPGEMEAIGGPSAAGIPLNLPPAHSYIVSRSPNVNDTGVTPEPAIHIVVAPGSTTIDSTSFQLSMDGGVIPATVTPDPTTLNEFDVDSTVTAILDQLSVHTLQLIYKDSLLGFRTNTWSFTVANYQNVNLPAPIYFENFDELAEGALPSGWSVTNNTAEQTPGFDLNDPTSDAYLSFVVITTNRLFTVFDSSGTYSSPGLGIVSGERRLVHPPIVLNGVLIDSLADGNLAYCDSDQRQNEGGQVDVMFTSDYNLTGQTNVYVAFNSLYEQNQDNMGSVEYSIDQGHTWLPVLYMFDDGTTSGDPADVVTNTITGQIDVFATFGTPRSDQAYGLAYSNFIGAAVSTNLIPYISPRINDDPLASKRIEVIRLPFADNQSHVRFRFGQAGTSSWYFGIDDFGLYSITFPVISTQPQSQTVDANTTATFSVAASGTPLTYQWRFNGVPIQGATNSTYVIQSVNLTNSGTYKVIVGGVTVSSPASLAVNTMPKITTDLSGEVADPGATINFPVGATGGRPLTFAFFKDNSLVASSTNNTFAIHDLQTVNVGNYRVAVMNSYGAVTGAVASLKIYAGPLSSNLVVHLTFDGNLNDVSGRGNNAAYQNNGAAANPNPTFLPGKLGNAFQVTTLIDSSDYEYATFGYPTDLQFGATNDFSFSFWCNYTNQGDDIPLISCKDWDSSSNPGWGLFTQAGGNYRINVTGPNGGTDKFSQTDTPNTLKDGNWHHVAVSIQHAPFGQSAFVYGYLDGVLVSKHPMALAGTVDTFGLPLTDHQTSVPIPASIQSQFQVNIGQDGTGLYTDNHSGHLVGLLDDFGIWRRALTAREVGAIYIAGMAGKDLSQVTTPEELFMTISGSNVNLSWMGGPTTKLQEATSLNPPNWTDVSGTLGASSAVVIRNDSQAFFRLSQ
jgi:hypothetical protein